MLRQFCLMVGGVFLVIGLWLFLWLQEAIRDWAVVPGALLSVAGLAVPAILKYPYQGWMWVGPVMGWGNTRIILGILFYGVVTPMGLVMKLVGRDPMCRGFEPDAQTYRVIRQPRPASYMKNMF
ncbi:MAG: SxtJ family membrane protein [Nitrospirota bacterium]